MSALIEKKQEDRAVSPGIVYFSALVLTLNHLPMRKLRSDSCTITLPL